MSRFLLDTGLVDRHTPWECLKCKFKTCSQLLVPLGAEETKDMCKGPSTLR
jgi:hypothetical protein